MSEEFTPDDAIRECLKLGAQGISLGLAKQLQAERDSLRAQLQAAESKTRVLEERLARALIIVEEDGDLDLASREYMSLYNTSAPVIALERLRAALSSPVVTEGGRTSSD